MEEKGAGEHAQKTMYEIINHFTKRAYAWKEGKD
jgi:hypothetical protein